MFFDLPFVQGGSEIQILENQRNDWLRSVMIFAIVKIGFSS